MPARHSGKVDKGWGYELIWATNELYCGKIMVFSKKGNKFSMHFHREKTESWFVNQGKFIVRWIDTQTATLYQKELVRILTQPTTTTTSIRSTRRWQFNK